MIIDAAVQIRKRGMQTNSPLSDVHIKELGRQLGTCKYVFDWIQVWNVYTRFFTSDTSNVHSTSSWYRLQPYQKWMIQLHASDMVARFSGLNVVGKGLLPAGIINIIRERRFKWGRLNLSGGV